MGGREGSTKRNAEDGTVWPVIDRRLSPQRKIGGVWKSDLPGAELGVGLCLAGPEDADANVHTKRRKDAMK